MGSARISKSNFGPLNMEQLPRIVKQPFYSKPLAHNTLVIDNGTCTIKAGFKSYNPQIIFTNQFYKAKNECYLTKTPQTTYKTIFDHDIIINTENLEMIIDFVLNFLVLEYKGPNPINFSQNLASKKSDSENNDVELVKKKNVENQAKNNVKNSKRGNQNIGQTKITDFLSQKEDNKAKYTEKHDLKIKEEPKETVTNINNPAKMRNQEVKINYILESGNSDSSDEDDSDFIVSRRKNRKKTKYGKSVAESSDDCSQVSSTETGRFDDYSLTVKNQNEMPLHRKNDSINGWFPENSTKHIFSAICTRNYQLIEISEDLESLQEFHPNIQRLNSETPYFSEFNNSNFSTIKKPQPGMLLTAKNVDVALKMDFNENKTRKISVKEHQRPVGHPNDFYTDPAVFKNLTRLQIAFYQSLVPTELIITDSLMAPKMFQIQKISMLFEVYRFKRIQIGLDCVYSYLYNIPKSERANDEYKVEFQTDEESHIVDSCQNTSNGLDNKHSTGISKKESKDKNAKNTKITLKCNPSSFSDAVDTLEALKLQSLPLYPAPLAHFVYQEIDLIVSIGHLNTVLVLIQNDKIIKTYKIPYAYKHAKQCLYNLLALKNIFLLDEELDEYLETAIVPIDYKKEVINLVNNVPKKDIKSEEVLFEPEYEDFYEFIEFDENNLQKVKEDFENITWEAFFGVKKQQDASLLQSKWYIAEKPESLSNKSIDSHRDLLPEIIKNTPAMVTKEKGSLEKYSVVNAIQSSEVRKPEDEKSLLNENSLENKEDGNLGISNHVSNVTASNTLPNVDSNNHSNPQTSKSEDLSEKIDTGIEADDLEDISPEQIELIFKEPSENMSFKDKLLFYRNTDSSQLKPEQIKERRKLHVLFKMGVARYALRISKAVQKIRTTVDKCIEVFSYKINPAEYIKNTKRNFLLVQNELRNREILKRDANTYYTKENDVINKLNHDESVDQKEQCDIVMIKTADDMVLEKILRRKLFKYYEIILNVDPDFFRIENTANKFLSLFAETELMRCVEAFFDPSVLHIKYPGINEILDGMPDYKVKNVFVTGGFSTILGNLKERLKLEVDRRSKYGPCRVHQAKDGIYDAFRGAEFVETFPIYTIEEFQKLGAEKILEKYSLNF